MTWPLREGLCRFAHEDMNPVAGWIDDKHFCVTERDAYLFGTVWRNDESYDGQHPRRA